MVLVHCYVTGVGSCSRFGAESLCDSVSVTRSFLLCFIRAFKIMKNIMKWFIKEHFIFKCISHNTKEISSPTFKNVLV